MSFWWVNHNKTFGAEFDGGYIWSPKENRDGSKNQSYVNLTLTRPGDTVFSYAASRLQAIGEVTSPCAESAKPAAFGSAGDAWSDLGWIVHVRWHKLRYPISPKDHIEQIAPLLPTKYSPIRKNGNGNQISYLAAISKDLGSLFMEIATRGANE